MMAYASRYLTLMWNNSVVPRSPKFAAIIYALKSSYDTREDNVRWNLSSKTSLWFSYGSLPVLGHQGVGCWCIPLSSWNQKHHWTLSDSQSDFGNGGNDQEKMGTWAAGCGSNLEIKAMDTYEHAYNCTFCSYLTSIYIYIWYIIYIYIYIYIYIFRHNLYIYNHKYAYNCTCMCIFTYV